MAETNKPIDLAAIREQIKGARSSSGRRRAPSDNAHENKISVQAAEQLLSELERMTVAWYAVTCELARVMQGGVFDLNRDPMALVPAIDAYADEEISGGRLRECIEGWIAGIDFRDKAARDWEES